MAQNENRWRNEGRGWSDDDRWRNEGRGWSGQNRSASVYDQDENRGYGRGDYGRGAYDVGDYGRREGSRDYGSREYGGSDYGSRDYGRGGMSGRGASDWQGGRETYGESGRWAGRDDDWRQEYRSGGYSGRQGSSGFGGYGGSGYAREDRMGRDYGMDRDYGNRSDWGRMNSGSDYGRGDYGRYSDRQEGYGEGRGFAGYRGMGTEYGYGEDRHRDRGWGSTDSDWGRSDWRRGRESGRGGYGEDRGFLERAGDEIASWFGDEDAERRRREDEMRAQHRGRGPRGYTRSDDRIREDVNDRLTDDPHIDASEIDVSVSNAEVTLSGTVDHRMTRRRAEDIVESISGVRHVQNNLRVRQHTGMGRGSGPNAGTSAGASAMAGMGGTSGSMTGGTTGNTTGNTTGSTTGPVGSATGGTTAGGTTGMGGAATDRTGEKMRT